MGLVYAEWVVNPATTCIICSHCNHEAYWDSNDGQQLFDYCPYCGYKMRIHKEVAGQATGYITYGKNKIRL